MNTRADVQHLIVQTHTASHEYDPEQALALFHALQPFVQRTNGGYDPYSHFRDADHYTDEDRIMVLFEMLDQWLTTMCGVSSDAYGGRKSGPADDRTNAQVGPASNRGSAASKPTSVPLASRYDWTADEGRSNSSEEYVLLASHVASLIREGAHSLLAGNADGVARTIVSHMAHKFNMGPPDLDELRRERGL